MSNLNLFLVAISYIYIYIYIYIYYHPQRDCFIVSRFIRVARHVRYLNLRSKPGQLYVIFTFYVNGYQVLNLIERREANVNSFARELNPRLVGEYIYIYISIDEGLMFTHLKTRTFNVGK